MPPDFAGAQRNLSSRPASPVLPVYTAARAQSQCRMSGHSRRRRRGRVRPAASKAAPPESERGQATFTRHLAAGRGKARDRYVRCASEPVPSRWPALAAGARKTAKSARRVTRLGPRDVLYLIGGEPIVECGMRNAEFRRRLMLLDARPFSLVTKRTQFGGQWPGSWPLRGQRTRRSSALTDLCGTLCPLWQSLFPRRRNEPNPANDE